MATLPPPAPLDPATSFKGHPQPSVNERLAQAKIFLADEDINRSLKFKEHLVEIEEYLKYIDEKKLDCDAKLHKDVKVMASVQRQWTDHMDASVDPRNIADNTGVPPYSTRLVDADTAMTLEGEREAVGLVTQMRPDHAPFTTDRSADQVKFLDELKKDAESAAEDINESENLLFVEANAYSWALDQPALIPYWMHSERGLPNTGITDSDSIPWYRSTPLPVAPQNYRRPVRRPPPDVLPDYLQARQDSINQIIRTGNRDPSSIAGLQDLLYPFEPTHLHELHTHVKELEIEINELDKLGLLEKKESSELDDARQKFTTEFDHWTRDIPDDGVQFKIFRDENTQVALPGLFYVLIKPTAATEASLHYSQDAINHLFSSKSQSATDNLAVRGLLKPFLPADIAALDRLFRKSCLSPETPAVHGQSPLLTTSSRRGDALRDERDARFKDWVRDLQSTFQFGGKKLRLKFRLPGEDDTVRDRDILSCAWPSQYFSGSPDETPLVPLVLKKLESEINDRLFSLSSDALLPEEDHHLEVDLKDQLQTVMYPQLRGLAQKIKAQTTRSPGLSSGAITALQNQFDTLFQRWRSGIDQGVEVRIPPTSWFQEDPNTLYYRGHSDLLSVNVQVNDTPTPSDFEMWATKIRTAKQRNPLSPNWMEAENDSNRGELYGVLANLQYPRLKRMDLEWTALYQKQNPTQWESQIRNTIRKDWRRLFIAWQNSFSDADLVVKKADPQEISDYWLGDPRVVYFRGPVSADTSSDSQDLVDVKPVLEQPLPLIEQSIQDKFQRLLASLRANACITPDDQKWIDLAVQTYWRPARRYLNLNIFRSQWDTEALKNFDDEYGRRSQIFIQQCLNNQFEIDRTPNGHFVAHDWTLDHVDEWKIPDLEDSHTPFNYADLLNSLWKSPILFEEQISDLECDINDKLHGFHLESLDTSSQTDEFGQLIHVLWPFIPPKYQIFLMDTTKNSKTVQGNKELEILDYIQGLVDASQVGWVSIHYPGSVSSIYDNNNRGMSHRLYFQPPTDLLPDASDEITPLLESMTLSTSGTTPIGFQRMEQEMNSLLVKYRANVLDFNDYDRIRILFYPAMSPSMRRLEDHLRDNDTRWRAGLLDFHRTADYVEKSVYFYALLDQWFRSFNDDIHLHKFSPSNPTTNDLVMRIENPWEVPPNFPSSQLPLPLVRMQSRINEHILNTPDKPDPLMQTVLESLFYHHQQRWRRNRLNRMRRKQKLKDDDALSERDVAWVNRAVRYKTNSAIKDLIWYIKHDPKPRRIRFIESRRGDTTWILVEERHSYFPGRLANDTIDFSDDAASIVDVAEFNTMDWIQSAKTQYRNLVVKVKDGTISTREHNRIDDILRFKLPEGSIGQVTQLLEDSINGRPISQDEQNGLIISVLQNLWQTFFDQHPEYATGFVGYDSQDPIATLLKNDLTQPVHPHLPVSVSDDQTSHIATEINQMLTSFQRGQLTPELHSVLDYLLRPLAGGRLAELFERITTLNEKWSTGPTKSLTLEESISLVDYRKQYDEEFREWKMTLPSGGIILDELYVGLNTVHRVIQRYQEWKKAGESVNKTAPVLPMGLDGGDAEKFRKFYLILKQFVIHGIAQDVRELLLDRIPFRLQTIKDEILHLLSQQKISGLPAAERVLLRQLQRVFVQEWIEWYETLVTKPQAMQPLVHPARAVDFTGKAERRGVQRAAVELALNLLATNQEQHRPHDRFRRVILPKPYSPPQGEVPLWLPLEPWQRPVEVDTLKYIKMMRKYREWKDLDYSKARTQTISGTMDSLPAPENFAGPYNMGSDLGLRKAIKQDLEDLLHIEGRLLVAEGLAPRPLVGRLLILIDESCTYVTKNNIVHPHIDPKQPLTQDEIDALTEVASPSWSDLARQFPQSIPEIEANKPWSMERLAEFGRDLMLIGHQIPFWRSNTTNAPSPDFRQSEYNSYQPSIGEDGKPQGWQVSGEKSSTQPILIHVLNDRLNDEASKAGDPIPPPWEVDEVVAYLTAMKDANAIFFDVAHNIVALIPPNGHPENKYVVSQEEAERSSHIKYNAETNSYEVRYDADGTIGPPIIQPNKFEHLQRAALKLGRDIGIKTKQLSTDLSDNKEKLYMQHEFIEKSKLEMDRLAAKRGLKTDSTAPDDSSAKDVSLRRMARDLNAIAPDLLKEAGITPDNPLDNDWLDTLTEKDAATVIQMQILEEANNCWEPRFPQDEHIWDFASSRLNSGETGPHGDRVRAPGHAYFDIRRWPLSDQTQEVQDRITGNGLEIQEKPVPPKPYSPKTRAQIIADRKKQLREEGRHTGKGQPPSFLLGETPFQQSWASYEIETDLADVDEFYPKPDPPNWFQRNILNRLKLSGDDDLAPATSDTALFDHEDADDADENDYRLPKIPSTWQPQNVSQELKRHDISERLLAEKKPKQPEELFFTPLEVSLREYYKQQDDVIRKMKEAREEIEQYCGMEWKYIKNPQRRAARVALNIDPVTEMKITPAPTPATQAATTGSQASATPTQIPASAILPQTTVPKSQPSPSSSSKGGRSASVPSLISPPVVIGPGGTITSTGPTDGSAPTSQDSTGQSSASPSQPVPSSSAQDPSSTGQSTETRGRSRTRSVLKRTRDDGGTDDQPGKRAKTVTIQDGGEEGSHEAAGHGAGDGIDL